MGKSKKNYLFSFAVIPRDFLSALGVQPAFSTKILLNSVLFVYPTLSIISFMESSVSFTKEIASVILRFLM